MCCAFQVLTEVSKHDIVVLRTFQALAAGIFTRPPEISEAHARHIHLCNNCLSTITGHQSLNVKGFPDDDLNVNQEKTQTASGFVSVGETPSFVRGLRDFVDLGLEDKQVGHPEDDAASVASRDTHSDASSEASFADVSSVESGHRGRSSHANERSASNMSKTYKKTRRIAGRKGDISSDSEDEIRKPQKTQKASKQADIMKKDFESSARARGGTGVRFNVKDSEDVHTESGIPKAQVERSLTKDSLYSAHTQGSSVTIPLVDEGELTENITSSGPSRYKNEVKCKFHGEVLRGKSRLQSLDQVVKTSVSVTNGSFQNYTCLDNHD